MSRYGKRFDDLARRWRVIEDEHDRQHPDRSECGGVGGCSMMFVAVNLQHEMIDALHEWRRKSGQETSKGLAEDPEVFTDGQGDGWRRSEDGMYRLNGSAGGTGWTIAEIREQYGPPVGD